MIYDEIGNTENVWKWKDWLLRRWGTCDYFEITTLQLIEADSKLLVGLSIEIISLEAQIRFLKGKKYNATTCIDTFRPD